MGALVIEVEGLVARKGGFRLSADLAVPAATCCAILGPSGSGKSTLLEAIAGFVAVETGTIRVAGRRIETDGPGERPVTLLFQEGNLFPHLDVMTNVALGLRPSLSPTAEERGRVEAVLAEVGLAGMSARRPEALSGGQRQRAALARALLRDRPVLLLDEPLAALGPALRDEMLDLIGRTTLARGASVLMVTHAPEDARRAASLTAVCLEGRIDGAHPTAALLDDPPEALRAYLG